jgi:lycopene beta-cyclase
MCVWADEWPTELHSCLEKVWDAPRVTLGDGTEVDLKRKYALINNQRLQSCLWKRFEAAGGTALDASVSESCHDDQGTTVATTAGNIRTWLVIDATGRAQRLVNSGAPATRFQTAFGATAVRTDGKPVDPLVSFMDFRPAHDGIAPTDGPSFLYALPLDTHRVFVEETVLTGMGTEGHSELRQRLEQRIQKHGLELISTEPQETCVIPMDTAIPKKSRAIGFGVAGGMVHPATGYSVGRTAQLAPVLARTLAEAQHLSPDDAAEKGYSALWPLDQQRRWALFGFGRDILTRLDTAKTQRFFAAFFELAPETIADWLSDNLDSKQLAAAMMGVFSRASSDIRTTLVLSAIRNPSALVRGLVKRPKWRTKPATHREAA